MKKLVFTVLALGIVANVHAGQRIELGRAAAGTATHGGNDLPFQAKASVSSNQKQADKICARLTGKHYRASAFEVAKASVSDLILFFPQSNRASVLGGYPTFVTHRFESPWPVGTNTLISDIAIEHPFKTDKKFRYFTSVTCE